MITYTSLLLIDDDADDQLLFIEAIAETGLSVYYETAVSGHEALQKLRETHLLPEIIFLDLNMPLMPGFECLRNIKSNPQWQHIPIIVFTTSNNPMDIHTSDYLGAAAYFCKPMHFNRLCSQLKKILKDSYQLRKKKFTLIE